MKILITCPYWLTNILHKELKKLWLVSDQVSQTWLQTEWTLQDIYNINIHSRIANKVYINIANWPTTNRDQLFDLCYNNDRNRYISAWHNISITVHSKNSKLTSTKTAQSICNKSIFKKLSWDSQRVIDNQKPSIDIMIIINMDYTNIFLNTSGTWLYQRWYRNTTWAAPIKENLAAWLILMSNRDFNNTFIDPFCGSWTILIEAAMIAHNIAPWLQREFIFQTFPSYDDNLFNQLKQEAQSQQFKDKKYDIRWYDIDQKILEIAQQNIENIWLWDSIDLQIQDITQNSLWDWPTTIITNPPYGKRLWIKQDIYTKLKEIFYQDNINWWAITNNPQFSDLINTQDFKLINLYNWADECIFYLKKQRSNWF